MIVLKNKLSLLPEKGFIRTLFEINAKRRLKNKLQKEKKLTKIDGWEVYSRDAQESIIFKDIDSAKSQTVFKKSHEIDIDPVTMLLTNEELLQFESGKAVPMPPSSLWA